VFDYNDIDVSHCVRGHTVFSSGGSVLPVRAFVPAASSETIRGICRLLAPAHIKDPADGRYEFDRLHTRAKMRVVTPGLDQAQAATAPSVALPLFHCLGIRASAGRNGHVRGKTLTLDVFYCGHAPAKGSATACAK
jgi:hypothetical protein